MKKLNGQVLFVFALLISCAGGAKEEKTEAGWDVTIRGKVGFPSKGEIKITEMRPDKPKPWEDTTKYLPLRNLQPNHYLRQKVLRDLESQ